MEKVDAPTVGLDSYTHVQKVGGAAFVPVAPKVTTH